MSETIKVEDSMSDGSFLLYVAKLFWIMFKWGILIGLIYTVHPTTTKQMIKTAKKIKRYFDKMVERFEKVKGLSLGSIGHMMMGIVNLFLAMVFIVIFILISITFCLVIYLFSIVVNW